jgi:molecular chaperone DnaJ
VKIPEGTATGTVFRVRGKGMPDVSGRGKGDLLVTVRGTTPRSLTREQKKLLEQVAATFQGSSPSERREDDKGIFGKVKDIFG